MSFFISFNTNETQNGLLTEFFEMLNIIFDSYLSLKIPNALSIFPTYYSARYLFFLRNKIHKIMKKNPLIKSRFNIPLKNFISG